MEITNKGKGWHLHFHLVIEAPFLPVREVSATWKKCNGGSGSVVWIEDASRGGLKANLPKYVTKYTGKGFRPHDWSPSQLEEFVNAVEGGRTFGVFGALLGLRAEWREWLAAHRSSLRKCDCGCAEKKYFSESDWWLLQNPSWPAKVLQPRPPPADKKQFAWRLK